MIEQLEAEEFHGFQTSGNTRPARMTCRRADGSRVDVFGKFSGGVRDHHAGLCAELICSLFARSINLATPSPFLLNLSKDFISSVPVEAQDLLSRSAGINFASEALATGYGTVPPEPRIPVALRRCAAEVFAFDIFIQNYDRKADNPNLLWDRTNIYLIDHERALHTVQNREIAPSIAGLELDRFYDHVFYSALSPSDCSLERLSVRLGALNSRTLDGWFDAIPEGWRNPLPLQRVREHIEWLIESRDQVCRLIQERIA